MKDPMDILAERLQQLESQGRITAQQRQKMTEKLQQAKAKP
ncbi:MAG TPA: hypothetical protein VLA24_12955 [Pseudomonadales bacterium]|nr:hypothetical protein [Pseudomonadales bacterium]